MDEDFDNGFDEEVGDTDDLSVEEPLEDLGGDDVGAWMDEVPEVEAQPVDVPEEVSGDLALSAEEDMDISALMDSAANQRTLSGVRSVAELFSDNGITVNTHVNKDLFSGINRVKSYLKPVEGKPKLYIFKNCVNMIREIKGYFWGNDDAPVKRDDHAMDELRYYISSRPVAYKDKPQKSWVQKDKERLYRKLSNRG